MRRTFVLLACLAALAAPAIANGAISVTMNGFDDGTSTRDRLTVTGTDRSEIVIVDEGLDCDSRLCKLTVGSVSDDVTFDPQSACRRLGARIVECAYFNDSRGSRIGTIDMRGGVDQVFITQNENPRLGTTDFRGVAWIWRIDFGAGDDAINGSTLLRIPGSQPSVIHTVAGGAGNDTFRGPFANARWHLAGDAASTELAGSGADRFLDIAGGSFFIRAGAGNDVIRMRSVATIEAGTGNDDIELSPQSSGQAAASVFGGDGDDRIAHVGTSTAILRVEGGSGNDVIRGGPNDDELLGNDGDDDIDGGAGSDRINGGAGADRITALDAEPDRVTCGTSSFTTTTVVNGRTLTLTLPHIDTAVLDLRDTDSGDCEDVTRQAIDEPTTARMLDPRLVAARGRVAIRLRCPAGARAGCNGRLALRAASTRGHLLIETGSTRYRLRRGQQTTLQVTLPSAVRAQVARRGWAVLGVAVVEPDSQGRLRQSRRTLVVIRG